MEQTIISRIQKLLALAGDKANEHEAEAALLKAQALMAEYGVDRSTIEAGKKPNVVRLRVFPEDQSKTNRLDESLAVVIGENFRCNVYRSGKIVMILGLEQDVYIFQALFGFALPTMHRLASEYAANRKRTDPNAPHARFLKNSFALGFENGLRQKFAEQVMENDWGIVLAKHPDLVKEEERLKIKPGKPFRRQIDVQARDTGYNTGRTFQFGTPISDPKPKLPHNN